MPECKLCGKTAVAGIVLHTDCVKAVVKEVCTYQCKWNWVCQDKMLLDQRHCRRCEMKKLADLLKEGESDA